MVSGYIPTIGLEIHAELNTQTKMFCDSKNDSEEKNPNVNTCPVCLAHPGTLPVINREAVRHVLRVGLAVGGTLADYTEFDRKNYFYPDLPKGYQISQYEYPLVSGGSLNDVKITRVHLEEDTASSEHRDATGETLIDFNRAGVPLMELVTEPVIGSPMEAGKFARELQLLLRYLGASEANMEKGEMRVEANVSVSLGKKLGTKVEIKNLNSFRSVERAIDFEIKRQVHLLESGGAVVQETRGWDEGKQATYPQRIKEGSADYRYFPDPDLPSLKLQDVPEFSVSTLREHMPELPFEKRARYLSLGLKAEDVEFLVTDTRFGAFYDKVTRGMLDMPSRIAAANYLTNDVVSIIRDMEERDSVSCSEIPLVPQNFREIISMVAKKEISSRSAKDLLLVSVSDSRSPTEIARELGLYVKLSKDLSGIVHAVIEQNRVVVDDYKAGKTSALQFLVGQGMKMTRGASDPEILKNMIQNSIEGKSI